MFLRHTYDVYFFHADSAVPTTSKKRQHVFYLRLADNKILVFQAEDDHIKEEWMKALKKVCN